MTQVSQHDSVSAIAASFPIDVGTSKSHTILYIRFSSSMMFYFFAKNIE